MITLALTLIIPLLVAIYTFNYGRWAWKQQLRLGGLGLYVLAAAAIGVPFAILWWNR